MFIINVPFCNLDQIYNSYIAPRWIKLSDSKYIIIHEAKAIKVEQEKERLIMGCTEDDFFNIWFEYFDLRVDYSEVNRNIKQFHRKFRVLSNRGSGIHLLNQNEFETFVYARLAQNIGFCKAREIMGRLAATYGEQRKNTFGLGNNITWYEWPSPEILLDKLDKKKDKRTPIKSFLKKLCEAILYDDYSMNENGNDLFDLLFLRDLSEFPSIEVSETITKNFKCAVDEFKECALEGLKEKGILYLYILHHIKNPPKETQNGFSR